MNMSNGKLSQGKGTYLNVIFPLVRLCELLLFKLSQMV